MQKNQGNTRSVTGCFLHARCLELAGFTFKCEKPYQKQPVYLLFSMNRSYNYKACFLPIIATRTNNAMDPLRIVMTVGDFSSNRLKVLPKNE